jgi:hypothetical protein
LTYILVKGILKYKPIFFFEVWASGRNWWGETSPRSRSKSRNEVP